MSKDEERAIEWMKSNGYALWAESDTYGHMATCLAGFAAAEVAAATKEGDELFNKLAWATLEALNMEPHTDGEVAKFGLDDPAIEELRLTLIGKIETLKCDLTAAESRVAALREAAEHAALLYSDLAEREGSQADRDAAAALLAALAPESKHGD